MPKCIYCLKDDSSTSFRSREHVIPACLGSFTPLNPTVTAKDGLICDACNTRIFSSLETNFIEDSYEGVTGQRLNIEGRNSVTIRGKNFKIDQLSGFGDKFFDEMFFFLKPQDGKLVPELKKQIKLRRFQGGYRVFLPEALIAIKPGTAKFKKISNDLKKLSQKDMCIFADSHESVNQIIRLLKDFGVNYKEKKVKDRHFSPGERLEIKEDYTCRINIDVGRVLAKIALNYFTYCTIQEKATTFLYRLEFDYIRKFISSGEGTLKEIIPSINEEPILLEEAKEKKRFIVHFITFREEDGIIVARTTFFGCPAVYKIILGKIPPEFHQKGFGCGHAFDPFSHQIHNLFQREPRELTEKQIRLSFGLFKRFC